MQDVTFAPGRQAVLAALHIMDPPSNEYFDTLTSTVHRFFGTLGAAISFIDHDRQWFKSMLGGNVVELPRSVTVCSYTINTFGGFTIGGRNTRSALRRQLLCRQREASFLRGRTDPRPERLHGRGALRLRRQTTHIHPSRHGVAARPCPPRRRTTAPRRIASAHRTSILRCSNTPAWMASGIWPRRAANRHVRGGLSLQLL
jgi:hypothetical protein